MRSIRYEAFEHTADKGIRAYGDTLEELFENAARGMFSLMADLERYRPSREVPIEVHDENPELTLKAWLDELLFIFEVERILFTDFRAAEVAPMSARGTALGLAIGPEIEWLGAVVKAVTYHALKVEQGPDGWVATVVFDV